MKMKKVMIIGAGEQGRVILNYLKNEKYKGYKVVSFIDDKKTGNIEGIPVIGRISDFKVMEDCFYFVALGDNHFRAKIIEKIEKEGGNLFSIRHPSSIVSRTAKIGNAVSIGMGAIVCNNVEIGNGVIIDTGSIVEHDCVLENYVNISPGSVLVSGNFIGEYSWIGAHSTINEDISIGKNCIIGAGSAILKNVPENSLVFGNPAKIKGHVDTEGKHYFKKK
jgi:acetyltransferase EpsM